MKKAISILVVLLLVAALFAGCNNGNDNVSSAPGTSSVAPEVSSVIPSEPIESKLESGEVSSHVDNTSSIVSGEHSEIVSGENSEVVSGESPAASK